AGYRVVTAARHTFGGIRHTETPEEFTQPGRHVVASEAIRLGVAIYLDPYGNDRRFDLLDNIGKPDGRLKLVGLFREVLGECRRIARANVEARCGHERSNAEACNRGRQQDRAAHGKRTRLLSAFWSGIDARVHLKVSIAIR